MRTERWVQRPGATLSFASARSISEQLAYIDEYPLAVLNTVVCQSDSAVSGPSSRLTRLVALALDAVVSQLARGSRRTPGFCLRFRGVGVTSARRVGARPVFLCLSL